MGNNIVYISIVSRICKCNSGNHRCAESQSGKISKIYHRGACIRQTVGQHNTADYNSHDGPAAEPLDCTVSHAQRQKSENRAGGNILLPYP